MDLEEGMGSSSMLPFGLKHHPALIHPRLSESPASDAPLTVFSLWGCANLDILTVDGILHERNHGKIRFLL